MTHICVSNLTSIGSDNGLSPGRRQAIIWTNAGILLIGPLGTNFSEFVIEIQTFSLKKIRLKMSSAKCCSFRLGLNVSNHGMLSVSLDIRITYSFQLDNGKSVYELCVMCLNSITKSQYGNEIFTGNRYSWELLWSNMIIRTQILHKIFLKDCEPRLSWWTLHYWFTIQ